MLCHSGYALSGFGTFDHLACRENISAYHRLLSGTSFLSYFCYNRWLHLSEFFLGE